MEKKTTTPVVAGLIISMVLIVLSIVAYIASFDQQSWYKWFSGLLFCAAIIYACTNFGKQANNNVTFGNVFAYGFKSSAVVACLMVVYIIIFMAVFPEMKEKALETARKGMQEKNNMSEEQIDNAMSIVRKSFVLFAVIGSIFIYLVFGVISALIGAAITKKEPQTPFQNQPLQ